VPRIPDFFIAGAPKCGTTALFEYLQTHPGIYLPRCEKEPHHFSPDVGGFKCHRYRNLDDYLGLFESAQPSQLTGEASVFYLFSSVAVRSILTANPNAKFIVMVRDPVEMAYSLHGELFSSMTEDVEDFETAWRLQQTRQHGHSIPAGCDQPSALLYRSVCELGRQLQRLFDLVPDHQRLVVLLEDLKNDPRRTYCRVLDFLGLADDGRDQFERVNASKRARSRFVSGVLSGARHGLGPAYLPLKRGLNRLGLQPYRFLWELNMERRGRKPLRPEFESELRDIFRPEIRIMERLLQRPLSHWSNAEAVAH
jgi:hypothetical protein